ncbi:MAG TPA: Sir2 family NAD-dependent protein deacetylase, partial [Mycobacterium sp.]|nr:Sir2 family NAD-dependent protein deacetylase [Mycobacterium sp.]
MRIAVLSGAGISAESGVPTFRDDKNGLWARFDPYELSSTQGWHDHPERVWAWYLWRHHLVR